MSTECSVLGADFFFSTTGVTRRDYIYRVLINGAKMTSLSEETIYITKTYLHRMTAHLRSWRNSAKTGLVGTIQVLLSMGTSLVPICFK